MGSKIRIKRLHVCKGCRIDDIMYYSEDEFFAYYKGHTIQIDRDEDNQEQFNILVLHPDGGALYDGCMPTDLDDRTMLDAIQEALYGSTILKRD